MIRTERLLLRPPRDEDLEALHAMFSDPETMRYWDRPPHERADTEAFLRGIMSEGDHLELIVEWQGRVVGRVGMWRVAEIGYIFDRAVWGQGIATEALAALIGEIRARFPEVAEITAEIDPRNLASHHVLTKLGFVKTHEEARTLFLNDEWCDSAFYALARG